MCGFVCVLVSLDGFKVRSLHNEPVVLTALTSVRLCCPQSVPINRLLRFEDLYKHVYPTLAAASGDISSLR